MLLHEIQGCLCGSNVILFGHPNLHKKPLFDNRKYNGGTLPRVREVFVNVAMYQEIGVKSHYCIINGLMGYFEWSISSCSLISSPIQTSVIQDSFQVGMEFTSCSPYQRQLVWKITGSMKWLFKGREWWIISLPDW